MKTKKLIIICVCIIVAACIVGATLVLTFNHEKDNYDTTTNNTPIRTNITEDVKDESSSSSQNEKTIVREDSNGMIYYSDGSIYSPQAERVIEVGEVVDSPGGYYRHHGYNEWEKV